jgi:two-component system phosphate regulon sensor histidine kinase PhoR
MTARIFLRIILAVLILLAVALATIDFLASRMAEKAYVDGLTLEMVEKTRMLGVMSRQKLLAMDRQHVRDMAAAAGARITIVDPSGKVLLDSEADPAKMENHAGRPEVRAALQGRTGTSIRMSPTVGLNFLYVAGPVPEGAARLALPLRAVDEQLTLIRKRLLGYTALAFLPAILLAALFARRVSRRLGAIIDFASRLSQGDFSARLEKTGNDELGILARQLNETGAKLQAMFEELEREHSELEKLERVRKDFVVNVSHELRTPLASIQGYAETLLDGAIDDEENNIRFLNIIRQNAERLTRLTADLLTLSRIELKSERLQPAAYRLQPLLEDCVGAMLPIADKRNILLAIEPMDENAEVFCDAEAVRQIVSNLLDNAIKYTPEDGTVTVTAVRLPAAPPRPELFEVSVTDTGIGIPAEELPRLFERFYRVDKARSRELGGTGLGLAIVKHLVRAHGGDVHVRSTPNAGSTFSFTLPVAPGALNLQNEFTEM